MAIYVYVVIEKCMVKGEGQLLGQKFNFSFYFPAYFQKSAFIVSLNLCLEFDSFYPVSTKINKNKLVGLSQSSYYVVLGITQKYWRNQHETS